MRKLTYETIFSVIVLVSFSFNAYSADKQCMPIGGMGLAEALDETHLVAAMSGVNTAQNLQLFAEC